MLLVFPYSESRTVGRTEPDLRQQASDLTVDLSECSSFTPSTSLAEHDLAQDGSLVGHLASHQD
jgi:hypothetical protein